ncbi:dyp-type peroxidase [Hericium alpestre]|uniref:Dyp-type peroxidase n=1 Tax=Hericium alpestre TaxID=135208 RepID=A0A4Y9ZYI4_9AGAM|nr:dyp-type peroxidase [Hericium alpestre]
MSIFFPDFHPDLLLNFTRRALLPNLGLPELFGIKLPGAPKLPDLNNVQGDVFYLFPKRAENFVFFTINDVQAFKDALANYKPTTSQDVLRNLREIALSKRDAGGRHVDIIQHQIALSRSGLNKLDQTEATLDTHFDNGPMIKEKPILGDGRDWDPIFNDGKADGVFIVAAGDARDCDKASDNLIAVFGAGLTGVVIVKGNLRPGKYKGHEHFGYEDGASQPALRGLVKPTKGQLQVDPGVIVMGYPGDPFYDNPNGPQRPAWTTDGTIMVFRKLEQDAVGFERYLAKNGPKWREWLTPEQVKDINPPLTDQEGAELFGARLVGRWKSGAPLANAPYRDNYKLAALDKRNDFDYTVPGQTGPSDRFCPFSAHTRKTAPRNLDPYVQKKFLESAVVVRAGIAYGPEIAQAERDNYDPNAKSPRGLLFVCYQSTVANGFMTQTAAFAGNDHFPTTSLTPQIIGQDPIIGGPSKNPVVAAQFSNQEFFVTSRGGEYFFVPSLSTLKALASAGRAQEPSGPTDVIDQNAMGSALWSATVNNPFAQNAEQLSSALRSATASNPVLANLVEQGQEAVAHTGAGQLPFGNPLGGNLLGGNPLGNNPVLGNLVERGQEAVAHMGAGQLPFGNLLGGNPLGGGNLLGGNPLGKNPLGGNFFGGLGR